MTAFFRPLLLVAALLAAGTVHAQAPTPEDHPGYPLAQAIAERGCGLHQEDVNTVLAEAGLAPPQFPEMAVALIEDGILAPTGEGTLTLVNWGLCVGRAAEPEAGEGAAVVRGSGD